MTVPTSRYHQIPHRRGSVSQDRSLLQMLITTSWSPGYPQGSSDLVTKRRFPWPPPHWILLFTRSAHRTQGNTYQRYAVYYIIKDMIKIQMNSQEKVHRVRSGRFSSARAFVPMELGCTTLLLYDSLLQPGTSRSWNFREASSHGCDQLLTPFPAPFLSLENGGEAENSKLFVMA